MREQGGEVLSGLFQPLPDGIVRLIAGASRDGRVSFPKAGEDMEPVLLPSEGRLWSFTVQRYRPQSPPFADSANMEPFAPFALGYVEFGPLLIEGRILISSFDALEIGMPMQSCEEPLALSQRGEVRSYAFRPLAGQP